VALTNFDQVVKFIADYRAKKIIIEDAPLKATVTSWWHLLKQFPRTREVFAKEYPAPVPGDPVPAGAIIGWVPPPETIDKSDPKSPKIRFPNNWRPCDGTNRTPKLAGKFLYGISKQDELEQVGGSPSHDHKIGIGQPDRIYHLAGGSAPSGQGLGHYHGASANEVRNLPPFVRVFWLCRVDPGAPN
jgi:hypothetical protein